MTLELESKRCFLFDLDGTLVDSSMSHEKAFVMALSAQHPDVASSFCYEDWKGYKTIEVIRALGVSDPSSAQTLTEAKQQHYLDAIDAGAVQLIPYAREVLQTLQQGGRRCFLVTSASRRSAQAILKYLEIDRFFELTITGDEVASAKPAPQCYLRCMSDAKVSPAVSIAIEDARAGVDSARAAGLSVIIVNNEALSGEEGYVESLFQLQTALTHALAK